MFVLHDYVYLSCQIVPIKELVSNNLKTWKVFHIRFYLISIKTGKLFHKNNAEHIIFVIVLTLLQSKFLFLHIHYSFQQKILKIQTVEVTLKQSIQ